MVWAGVDFSADLLPTAAGFFSSDLVDVLVEIVLTDDGSTE
jgi:hypothetical protein